MSEPWHRVVVGDPLLDGDPFAGVHRQFRDRFGSSSAARLFTRLESAGDLHCVAVAYLSPEASTLARELGSHPVPRPAWIDSASSDP